MRGQAPLQKNILNTETLSTNHGNHYTQYQEIIHEGNYLQPKLKNRNLILCFKFPILLSKIKMYSFYYCYIFSEFLSNSDIGYLKYEYRFVQSFEGIMPSKDK